MRQTTPSLPDGLRIYAIGDVHGRFDLLEDMAGRIRDDLFASPANQALEIFIGDYIDRGPQSRDVVDWLMETPPLGDERICLMGNHENMLLSALADASDMPIWLQNGGDATLASYGVRRLPRSVQGMHEAFRAAIPGRHRDFYSGLPLTAEFGSYFFVHAGINPDRPLHNQDPHDLVWIREPFHRSTADFGCIIVHGHTPVVEPEFRPNRINIDTGAVFTGHLTCLVLEGAGRRVLQTPPQ